MSVVVDLVLSNLESSGSMMEDWVEKREYPSLDILRFSLSFSFFKDSYFLLLLLLISLN